jgi:cytoskeletal protein RodZ
MKRKKQPHSKKIVVLCVAICVIAAALGGVALWKHKQNTDKIATMSSKTSKTSQGAINYDPPTTDEQNTSEQQKEDIIKKETATPSPSNSIVVSIVRAGQLGTGQAVQIRTLVSGATSGTCTATLTKSGAQTIKKTGTIVREATSVSCEGLDVAANEFNADGDWDLSITAMSNGTVSSSVNQKVTVIR